MVGGLVAKVRVMANKKRIRLSGGVVAVLRGVVCGFDSGGRIGGGEDIYARLYVALRVMYKNLGWLECVRGVKRRVA